MVGSRSEIRDYQALGVHRFRGIEVTAPDAPDAPGWCGRRRARPCHHWHGSVIWRVAVRVERRWEPHIRWHATPVFPHRCVAKHYNITEPGQ